MDKGNQGNPQKRGGTAKRIHPDFIWWNIPAVGLPRKVSGMLRNWERSYPPRQLSETQRVTEVGTPRANGTKCFSDWQWKFDDGRLLHTHTHKAGAWIHGSANHWGLEQASQHGNLGGFSADPSAGGAVEGVHEPTEDEIAEKIFDWWISGKSYTEWYAEKYLQLKIDWGEELDENDETEDTL